MRYLFSLALLLGSIQLSVCQVTTVEYFLDQDPGFGKATSVSITAGTDISKNFIVPINTLGEGFHTLFIRAKDAQDHWSLTGRHTFIIAPAKATNVSAVEYFIDTDPGFGKGTAVPFTVGSNISTDVIIPLTNVAAGYHVLHVRSKDDLGQWSLTTRYTFYVYATAGTAVTGVEYFIDTDPGFGNGTALPAVNSADASIQATIPLTDVSYGFHTLSVRARDNQGRWSLTTHKVFYVDNAPSAATITALEYYFNTDNTISPTYTYTNPEPAAAVDLDFTANLSELEPNKEYTMNIRAVSSNGQKSQWYSKKVKVCDGAVSQAAFEFNTLGTEVSLIDSSSGATKYVWDFGDGKTDSVSNPVHQYATGGLYQVKQAVSNYCNSDTLVRVVQVLSLQNISPNKGGNTGTVTVTIAGGGFTDKMQVKLVRGNKEITGTNVIAREKGKVVYATFDLVNQELGTWDVVINSPANSGTLSNAFTVEQGTATNLGLQVAGQTAIRLGREQQFSLVITNNNNIDAKAVPVWLSVPNKATIVFSDPLFRPAESSFDYGTIPLYITVDTVFSQPLGYKTDIYPLVISRIPANASYEVKFKMTITENINLAQINAWAFKPVINSPPRDNFVNCLVNSIQDQIKTALDPTCITKLTNYLKILEENPCLTPQKWETEGVSGEVVTYCQEVGGAFGSQVAYIKQMITNWGIDCLKDKIITIGAKKIIDKTIKDYTERIVQKGIFFGGKVVYDVNDDCNTNNDFLSKLENAFRVVVSKDPNEKRGPKGHNDQNYNRGITPFNYTVYFENVDTATAAAQEVMIIDTLDKTKFDLSTFTLKSFGFGGKVNKAIPRDLQAYSTNTLLQRTGKTDMLVRTDATLDTATGILHWRFLSLDASTRELVSDPLDGFLPPNKTNHEGEGFISYSVQPKKSLAQGTVIKNNASIVFDVNEAIITNEHVNTIDKVAPESKVSYLPPQTTDTTFTVSWSGTDNGAGIRSYDVYYATNNGSFSLWLLDVATTSSSFTGKKDSLYKFYCIAKDYAGNEEAGKTTGEASILVVGKVTAVGDPQNDGFYFRQNYPNPAITDTWIEFGLPVAQQVTINIRDIQGKLLGTVTNKLFTAGVHKLNYRVSNLPGGLYILEFDSKRYKRSIKLMKQ